MFDPDDYAARVRRAFDHLKLGSIDTEFVRYERRVRLQSVYTPQTVKKALPQRDVTRDYLKELKAEGREPEELEAGEFERRKEAYRDLTPTPVLEFVDDPKNQRIVILGDPGLGKSTLLRLLALRSAHDRKLPLALYLELRLARTEGRSFLEYLDQGDSPLCCLPELELDRYLRSEPSVVLFDALDEVDSDRRSATVGAILKFAGDYPKARIVVTTRIYGYYPGSTHWQEFRDAGFEQATLQDFQDDEIKRFVDAWHREAFQDPVERAESQGRVERGLAESRAIRELAGNPLLLTLLSIVARVQDLPRDRVNLYDRCAHLLLDNWQLGKSENRDKLGPDQKMRILQCVAAKVQEEKTGLEGNVISEANLRAVIEEQLRALAVPEPWFEAGELIRKLRERNFMLAYLGDRQYGFVHRTFLEYFRAEEIRYRLEKTGELAEVELLELFHQSWRAEEWKEPLRLVCGLIGPARAGKCIGILLDQSENEDGENAVFLASECLREVREVTAVEEVRDRAWEAIVRLADPFPGDSGAVPSVRDQLRRLTRTHQAVEVLAKAWGADSRALRWLRRCAEQGESSSTRHAAMEQLALHWSELPETLDLIEQCAQNDDLWPVRRAAVGILTKHWGLSERIRTFLQARVRDDSSSDVQEEARELLEHGWRHPVRRLRTF